MRSPRRTLPPAWRPVIISCLITSSDGADITSSEVNDDIVLWHRLASTNNYLGIYDQDDRVVFSKRLPNELGVVLQSLEPYKGELAGIAVELTYNWLVDGLMDQGYRVSPATPAANEQYSGLKYTDDRYDSRWLARMQRAWDTEDRIHIPERGATGSGSTAQANEAGSAPHRAYPQRAEHDNSKYRE